MNENNENTNALEILPKTNYEFLVAEGRFELIGYDELSAQIDKLGEYLSSIEVTDENLQTNKKLVAQVRKMCKDLNQEKVEFKKHYMTPYNHLEGQIKTLIEKTNNYENLVRNQIRNLEEQERAEKKVDVHKIFNLRLRAYGSERLYPFDKFFKKWHTNKSTSISKVEKDMVDWFEQRKMDIDTIETYASLHHSDFADIYDYYNEVNNLADTLKHFDEIAEKRNQVVEDLDNRPQRRGKTIKYKLFQIREEDEAKVKELLDDNNIDFKII